MLYSCMWVLCSLLVDNSDSPSIVEQSQQGCGFQLQFFIDNEKSVPLVLERIDWIVAGEVVPNNAIYAHFI